MKENKEHKIYNVPLSLVSRHCSEEKDLPAYRTEFMRDRDRLMYATAFRRLSGKTQIYTVGRDDHRKNRLTHTLEVAQIARTISHALGFDSDLVEAIALAHDFGHTPFGHAGERILHDIMTPGSIYVKNSPFYEKGHSKIKEKFEEENPNELRILDSLYGFKHNLQSVRVTALLEDSYRNDAKQNIGLNLTNFSLYGMMIHSALRYKEENSCPPSYQNLFDSHLKLKGSEAYAWSFEAYIVKWADDIAQWHHDFEDAMRDGVLPIKKICDTIRNSLENALTDNDRLVLSKIEKTPLMDRHCISNLSHIVVHTLVNDLVENSEKNLKALCDIAKEKGVHESEQLFTEYDSLGLDFPKDQIIIPSTNINTTTFENVIRESIHHSRNVERMNEKGKYIIRKLFEAYFTHPQQLPDGPILHLLVELYREKYPNIDEAKKIGIGEARVDFDKIIEKPQIYTQCMLMRRICDHIASMTDHYAIDEYNNLYG